jgi:hypothetical protein
MGHSPCRSQARRQCEIEQTSFSFPVKLGVSTPVLKKRCRMLVQKKSTFPHRCNPDKTYDSICRVCYLTVASSHAESDLTEPENLHACDPTRLFEVNNHLPAAAFAR